MDQKTEIRSYIKCRIRLNIDSKQIFNELFGVIGISMRTVFRWLKAFKAGKFSVEDDTRPGRPKASVTKANIATVKIVVEQEPQRRADNKQWKRKDEKRPCIAKRTISSKNMLYAIFSNSSGPIVQVPCPSGHTVTGRFYKNYVLKKVKEFYNQAKDG